MENFAIELKKEAENASKAERDYLNQFIPVFFNCWNKNSVLLMLGVEDKTILRNVVGENADFIIEDEAKYLIHISKVSDAKRQVRFAFREFDYSFEQKEYLREFFRFYGKLTPEIDNQLDNGRLTDTLNLNESIEKICADKKKLIVTLSGEGLIDALYIDTPFISDSNFLQFVEDIFIIPCKYRHLTVQSAERNNSAKTETFWEYLNDSNVSGLIHNPHCYNFVFLNSKNDDVLRIFMELMKIYLIDFNLKDTSTELLLKRIFFVCDDIFNPANPASESRGTENMSDYEKRLMKVIGMNPDKLMSASMNAELYLALLKIFNYFDLQHKETKRTLPSLLQIAFDYTNCLENAVNQLSARLVQDLDDFPIKIAEIENSLIKLNQDCKTVDDRDVVFRTLETNQDRMADMSKTYSPSYGTELEKISSNESKKKSEFLETKHFLFKTVYKINKTDFIEYVSKCIDELFKVLESIKKEIRIPSQKILYDAISAYGEYNSKLNKIKTELPNTGSHDIVNAARYYTVMNLQRLFEVESYYESIINRPLTYDILMGKERTHIHELKNAVSQIQKRIQTTSSFILSYLSDIKQQESHSDTQIRTMLLNESYSELNCINS